VPKRKVGLFDHLVGAAKERKQLNFRALLDRQIRRLFALENPAGIYSDEAMSICNARPAVHQADCDYGWLLDRTGQRRRLRVMNPGGRCQKPDHPIRGPVGQRISAFCPLFKNLV
jgi:hypothetical protein